MGDKEITALRGQIKELESEKIELERIILKQASEANAMLRRIEALKTAIRKAFVYINSEKDYDFCLSDETCKRLIEAMNPKIKQEDQKA